MSDRRWRSLMWSGVGLAVLGLLAWCVSLMRLAWCSRARFPQESPQLHWNVTISDGLFQLTNRLATDREGWWRMGHSVRWGDLYWWPFKERPFVDISRSPMGSTTWAIFINVPLWMPVATGLSVASLGRAMSVRLRGRARRGLCVACGYDRRGLAHEAPCPECGGTQPLDSAP